MQFNDVLTYLSQLVNIELQPINDANDPLVILNVDPASAQYTIDKTSSTKKITRTFKELQKIWEVLSQKGYVSVDQALGGSGTSRHQPETILANLPFIEHFKYDRKKHLYLRKEYTHRRLGTLKELSLADSREIKKRIDRYRDFDISQFHSLHSKKIQLLEERMDNIFIKYPGESDVDYIKDIFSDIHELELKLSEAVVSLESSSNGSVPDADDGPSTEYDDEPEMEDKDPLESEEDIIGSSPSIGLQATRISQVTPTISLIYDRVQHNEIDLQPDFQRKDGIWNLKNKARLIESVLLGLPLPVFYFAERPNKTPNADVDFEWVVIDGLQRITTLVGYMKGEFSLKDLEKLPHYNDLGYKSLPRKEQRKIREYQIHGHLIQISKDSDEMIRELFHRINTYGSRLSAQEIRSALYPGSTNKFLKHFAETVFVDALPSKINPDRMLDLEYILRAVSFLVFGYRKYFYSTADEFLSHCMKVLNGYQYIEEQASESAQIFSDIDYRLKASFKVISDIFGNDSYKKEEGGKINKVLFELLVSTFSLMTDKQREISSETGNASEIKSKLLEMIKQDKETSTWTSPTYSEQQRGFNYSISNSVSKKVTVLYRFESLVDMINEVTNMAFDPKPLLENQNKLRVVKND